VFGCKPFLSLQVQYIVSCPGESIIALCMAETVVANWVHLYPTGLEVDIIVMMNCI
jgi:hypothetical protein